MPLSLSFDATDRNSPDIPLHAVRSRPVEPGTEAAPVILDPAEAAELVRLSEVIDYPSANARIFEQGDEAEFVYLLADGLVRAYHSLANGERQIVAFNWPGDVFGLAENGRYRNSAETITSSRIRRFSARRLEDYLLSNSRLQGAFLVKAVHDLRRTQRQLVVMGRHDIARRLAAFLIDCTAHPAYFDPASATLRLPMSRYDIADYLGTSAESVARALAKMEEDRLLRRSGPRVVAVDLPRLRRFIDDP